MSCRMRPLSTAFILLLGLGPANLGAQTIVVVDENNMNWGFADESSAAPSGTSDFVLGPATPPRGSGSVHLTLGAMTDGVAITTQNHAGTRFADITTLTYQTYQNVTPQAIALQLNVDYDDGDASTAWQGRLVFEPLNAGAVMTNTWQLWNGMAGSWWSTGMPILAGNPPVAPVCTQGSPCPWLTLLSTYPNLAIHNLPLGAIYIKAGSGWAAGFDGHADELHIQTAGFNVIYDFETIVPVELQSFSIE